MVVMDFDPEKQLFMPTEREMKVLQLHPAWGKCSRDKAASLYTYIVRQATISVELPKRPFRRQQEMRRQLAARELAQVMLAQLEPFIDEDARALADQLTNPTEPPETLE